jgi:hypothetical protein
MGLIDYQQSQRIAMMDPSFNALIMAAVRKADDKNLELLLLAFPRLVIETRARYNAPGGALSDEEFKILEWQAKRREE